MKIRKVEISNFRSLENAVLEVGDILALVGRNNSGKSSLLGALNLFFNPLKRYVSESLFTDRDLERVIRILVTFEDLSAWEEEKFGPWLHGDQLIVGREIRVREGDYEIANIARVRVPEPEWLRQDSISGESISEWWADRDELRVGELDFAARLGGAKPRVGDWKEAARLFVAEFEADVPWLTVEQSNPKGAQNVLTGFLPEFIYVPAVRDVTDEAKVTQSNPFGQLIHAVLDEIADAQKEEIAEELRRVAGRLNRAGEAERLTQIAAVEERLNELMNELMDCDVEIEMALPELKEVFGQAKIYADDGIRTAIEFKGHGMQRSMIMTILRQYAELASARKAGDRAAERSAVIAIEEPELYLHPQSQRTLMSIFRQIASGRDQVLYSTHSDLFVEVDRFDDVCRLRRGIVDGRPRTSVTQLTIPMLKADLRARTGVEPTEQGLREQYRNAFGSAVSEGFFADSVAIVEGPSEANLLPLISRALGVNLDRENVAVVYSDGKGQMDRLLRVFSGFDIPCFLWFDADRHSGDAANHRKTLELLTMVGSGVRSIDEVETHVGETYAVLEDNLEATLDQELPEYNELLDEASAEYGPCGKPLRCRYIGAKLLERALREGSTDHVPETIRQIVDAIQGLERAVVVLHPDAEQLRPH